MADNQNTRLIPLSQGKFALVDEEDFEWLSQWKWYYHHGYAIKNISCHRCPTCGTLPRKTVYMHRDITKIDGTRTQTKLDIDHINRNKIDNRKINLRITTRSQNMLNTRRKNKLYSQYKGVSKPTRGKPFCTQINIKGKTVYSKSFNTEIEAAKAYNEKAKELFGEYACLNIIEE